MLTILTDMNESGVVNANYYYLRGIPKAGYKMTYF